MKKCEENRANELKEKMIEAIKNVMLLHSELLMINLSDILRQVRDIIII